MSFSALVLAGSRGGFDPLAAHAGTSDKALIEVGGSTMLARVVAALREAGASRVAVSASSEGVAACAAALGAEPLPAAAGPSMSVGRALDRLGAPLLVTTADHALLRPEWVVHLLDQTPAEADVSVLLAERAAIEATVPATRRTYLRFADGAWSGCNLFYLRTPSAAAAVALWREVEADRKRPWRIVRRLGPIPLLRYALGRLTLPAALDRLGAVAGVTARAVPSPWGLAAVDVDSPADLRLVRDLLREEA